MIWIALSAVVLGAILFFNSFVRLRNKTREAFSGVDVQLERRHDLVPNLVKTVRAYVHMNSFMSHSRSTFSYTPRTSSGSGGWSGGSGFSGGGFSGGGFGGGGGGGW